MCVGPGLSVDQEPGEGDEGPGQHGPGGAVRHHQHRAEGHRGARGGGRHRVARVHDRDGLHLTRGQVLRARIRNRAE